MKIVVLICFVAVFLPGSLFAGVSGYETQQTAAKSVKETKKKAVKPVNTAKAKAAMANFRKVSKKVEPIAENICRSLHPKKPQKFCDFQIKVRNDGNEKANAFQSAGKGGRPVITFNINMLLSMRNDDEIVFVLGHEVGHQIAQHLAQTRVHEAAGALLGSAIIDDKEDEKDRGERIGTIIGGLAYSKQFELEADVIATHITDRAGYNARKGSRELARTGGSSNWNSSHPPSQRRLEKVGRELRKIRAAKRRGERAPIIW